MTTIDLNDLKDPQKRQALREKLVLELTIAKTQVDTLRAMIAACDAMSPQVYRNDR